MTYGPTRQTALHISKMEDGERYVATVVTANSTYLNVAFDFESNLLWIGTQNSPAAMDLMRLIHPTTVFAAAMGDVRDIGTYLLSVADALESSEGNVKEAFNKLHTQQAETGEKEKPKRKRGKKKGGEE